MNPTVSDKPSINPRQIVSERGAVALAELLAGTGYMVQERVLNDLVQAIKKGAPHLIEGERGSGKTALAEALAEACNLPTFYLQGMEGLELEDVLYSWDREGQSQFVRQAIASGMKLAEARAQQWGADYLLFGEALGAFEFAARTGTIPILIVDEIDKLPDTIEDMLLQLFGRGYAHVPRYGDVGEKDPARWPIVVLLSNDIRHDLSAPMRSRCVYTWMDMPSAKEEVAILHARVPGASAEAVGWVAKLLDCIRGIPGVQDKPALREGIDLLKAFMRDRIEYVDEAVLTSYLCLIAKRRGDRSYLEQSMARIDLAVNSESDEIDSWVEQDFMRRTSLALAA
ncbi:MAG TPA: AAA family ATPase [Pyrinomonadaceae bacterium]|nr:AAA family ATPase [Pyrinomonadaceae bacterium]